MIEKLEEKNVEACINLAHLLWPDSEYNDLKKDFHNKIGIKSETCFLYSDDENEGKYLGFIQMSLRRDYVEGSNFSPVAYIEGIYIIDGYRKKGIARKLINVGENWGKEMGCTEIASDCEQKNNVSIDFHKSIGFEEANRIVCFIKEIK